MHVAIVGNGVTGVSAAMRIRELQPDWKITMISGESTHHYARPALMYIFMGHMRYEDTKPYEDHVWGEKRIDLVRDWVTGVDTAERQLDLHRGGKLSYDKLLIATGSQSNKFGWPGQDLDGVQGLWDLMDLDLLYRNCRGAKHGVIVGGGLIGIELAEMMHARGMHVTFLVREKSYWSNVLPPEESAMVSRVIREGGFDLRLESELEEILAGPEGRARAIRTKAGEELPAEVIGLTAGVHPNIDLAKAASVPTGRGVLVDWSLHTQVDGVFAAGDCAELVREGEERNFIQQVWYSGKAQGRVAGEVIAGRDVVYDPGTWYNSAKFLDLEYQTYGRVNMRVEGEQNIYWESPDGQRALRLVHTADEGVIGVNVMGIRYRHEVCAKWIDEHWSVERVIDDLPSGNFDTEFFRRYEPTMAGTLREQMS